jgi:tetratricopeptide (TPR) repeat protein
MIRKILIVFFIFSVACILYAQPPTEIYPELTRQVVLILPFVQIGEGAGSSEVTPLPFETGIPPGIDIGEAKPFIDVSWLRNAFPLLIGITFEKTHMVLVSVGDEVMKTCEHLKINTKAEIKPEDAILVAKYMGCYSVVVGTYEKKSDEQVKVKYSVYKVDSTTPVKTGELEVTPQDIQLKVIQMSYDCLGLIGINVSDDVKNKIGDHYTKDIRALRWASKCIGLPITGQIIGFASKAVEDDPDFAYAYTLMGDAYMFENDFDTANYNYDIAIRLDSDMPSFYILKGVNYYMKGKQFLAQNVIITKGLKDALQSLLDNLKSAPFNIDDNGFNSAKDNLINEISLSLKDGKMVSGGLSIALGAFKDSGGKYKDTLGLLGTIDKFFAVTEEMKKARDESKGKVPVPEDFGYAEAAFKQALTVDPGYATSYVRLAKLEEEKANRLGAIELLKKSLVINQKQTEALVMLGNNYWYYGATSTDWKNYFGLAIDAYKKALEIQNDKAVTHYNIASLYLKVKDAKNAIYHYERYLELEPNAENAEDVRKTVENLKTGKYE